jgi:branched-chain amino acid transport system substrate-binding protein
VVNSVLIAEAIATAQKSTGKQVVTAVDVRDGLETMKLDAARLGELGLTGFMQPFAMSCRDHASSNQVYIQEWDGQTWKPASDWFRSDREVVWPLLEQAAQEYVKSNQPWPARETPCS